jgi:Flp pilus assembly protein TadD
MASEAGREIRLSVRAAYERAIAHHRAGQSDAAEEIYRQIIAQRPRHAGALHHLGVLTHQRGKHAEAERLIRQSLSIEPADADAWSNLGLVLRGQARLEEARASLEEATRIDSENISARKNLAVVLGQLGRHVEAADELQTAHRLAPSDPALLRQLARALLLAGRPDDALPVLEKAHAAIPDDVEVLNQLALGLLTVPGRFEESLRLLARASELAPDDTSVLNNYGVALKRAGRLSEAVACFRRVLTREPDDLAALTNLGDVLNGLGQHEEAVEHLRRAVALSPKCAEAHNNLGVALGELERFDEAIVHLEAALAANPNYAPAHHNLGNQLIGRGCIDEGMAQLRATIVLDPACVAAWYGLASTGRHSFSAAELTQIETLMARPGLSPVEQSLLHFALAHAVDKSGPPERAFAHATRANALRRASDHARGQGYDRAAQTALVDALIATFTPEFFRLHVGEGPADELPVFVTGMPRSGTTLVEQILCSHPQIHGAGELNDISRAAFGLGYYPRCLTVLSPEQIRELAAAYRARLRALGHDSLRVVDKMTVNFLHLGFISLLFPSARIIHLRRDPRDVALSCYFHNFSAPGLNFAFDLADLAHFHREHDRIMAHWRAVLPRPIHEVEYEDLVAHPEPRSRALVEFCGLEWDDRCLAFHRHERRVRTASALQVREPIYTRSVARWRRYEKELAPFLDAGSTPLGGEAWKTEAIEHARARRWQEALGAIDCALAFTPTDARAHNNRGVILTELGRRDEALAAYREAIRLEPAFAKAHNDLGLALYHHGSLDEARVAFDEAIRLDPAHADAWHNRGLLRTEAGELEAGAADLDRAACLNPANAETWNTLGATLQVLTRVDEAVSAYERALTLAPEHAMAHYNRACARLLRGDFARGWPEHEWRLERADFRSVRLEASRWDGGNAGTVLLLAEQGLGDTLQFVRYAPLVRERAAHVILAVQPALLELLKGTAGTDELVAKGGPFPPFDSYAPLLSLPHLLGAIPAPNAYLNADSRRQEHWRLRLATTPGLRVGLNWQGNPRFPRDYLRSIPLRAFAPLTAVPGVQLHSLHLGPGFAQISDCGFPLVPLSAEFDENLGAFVDTAAAMRALDLVITSDTSLAHLAGALGVPVWVILSASPDWRWRNSGDTCAWYPNMRLFRQEKLCDWTAPIAAIVAALREISVSGGIKG